VEFAEGANGTRAERNPGKMVVKKFPALNGPDIFFIQHIFFAELNAVFFTGFRFKNVLRFQRNNNIFDSFLGFRSRGRCGHARFTPGYAVRPLRGPPATVPVPAARFTTHPRRLRARFCSKRARLCSNRIANFTYFVTFFSMKFGCNVLMQ
jgi:hypothetical protein